MDKKLGSILDRIDKLREELHGLIDEKGIYNDEVIEMSRKVDELLNEYQNKIKKS